VCVCVFCNNFSPKSQRIQREVVLCDNFLFQSPEGSKVGWIEKQQKQQCTKVQARTNLMRFRV
jgi:hypothetical protein